MTKIVFSETDLNGGPTLCSKCNL